jgi:predicted TIM-barrel fold metal-dependent hydrolase
MHLINFDNIPDEYYYHALYRMRFIWPGIRTAAFVASQIPLTSAFGTFSQKIAQEGIKKMPTRLNRRIVRSRLLTPLWGLVSTIARTSRKSKARGSEGRRLLEAIRIFRQNPGKVADLYVEQMIRTNTDVATPLMWDATFATPSSAVVMDYNFQVAVMHEQMLRHPGRFLPFVMFDPRREGGLETVKGAVSGLGFGGVKLDPALGFHVVPESPVNQGPARQALCELYEWAESEGVPITAHCSPGGAVSDVLSRAPGLRSNLCRPYNWGRVLECWPGLLLNLAHFGGHYASQHPATDPLISEGKDPCRHMWEDIDAGLSRPKMPRQDTSKDLEYERAWRARRWRNDILCLMRKYPNVYTDVSYNDLAHLDPGRYFRDLKYLLADESERSELRSRPDLKIDPDLVAVSSEQDYRIEDKILFGSDWPTTAHTWNEAEWIAPFKDESNLPREMFAKLTYHNPRRFLKASLKRNSMI